LLVTKLAHFQSRLTQLKTQAWAVFALEYSDKSEDLREELLAKVNAGSRAQSG
jgi:hypothetical protein